MILKKPALYTDLYELTMAQGYFLSGRGTTSATFDYFFRSLPFDGGYAIFAGIGDLLEILKDFRFHPEEIAYLKQQGFKDEFLDFLKNFRFNGTIYSVKEGEVVFANEPLVKVEGTIIEAQLLETILLNTLNFSTLIATKASRVKQAAGERAVVDFGLRRSQGLGGLQASKSAVIGGIQGSSNVLAGQLYDIPIKGTMAHSWVQSFEDELESFRTYARHYPDSTILLVDTYDTLKSGVPNAIKVAKELEDKGHKLVGIRLDSGDLAYFAHESRKLLDEAGFDYVKIAASNQLDEYLVKSLLDQGAPIDLFGVGTNLVTAADDPALDGVYKLSSIDGKPTLKISENEEKITLPGSKKLIRYLNTDGTFNSDGIALQNESIPETIYHPYLSHRQYVTTHLKTEELLQKVVDKGTLSVPVPTPYESASYAKQRLSKLNPEHKRFDYPHVYKVGLSKNLRELKNELIQAK